MSLSVVMLVLQTKLEVRQLFFRGQLFFFLQLQLFSMKCILLVSRIFQLFLNYGLQVVCAAITNFYIVFVENIVVLVIFRKMFTDKVQKLSANVCLYIYAVRRIKPNYVSLSVLTAVLYGVSYRFLAFSVDFVMSTLFKCTFVVWFGFVKEFFA